MDSRENEKRAMRCVAKASGWTDLGERGSFACVLSFPVYTALSYMYCDRRPYRGSFDSLRRAVGENDGEDGVQNWDANQRRVRINFISTQKNTVR